MYTLCKNAMAQASIIFFYNKCLYSLSFLEVFATLNFALDLKRLTAFIFFADVTMYSFGGCTLQNITHLWAKLKLQTWKVIQQTFVKEQKVCERTEFRVISCPSKSSTGILRGTKLVNGVDPRDSKQVHLLPGPTTSVHIPSIFCWSNTWC